MTLRDFTQVFDAYVEFEESVLSKQLAKEADAENVDLDLRLARFEKLMDRRPFLVNDVLLRQNPNNVLEWAKRVELYETNKEKVSRARILQTNTYHLQSCM
jgi:pre-mRNA-splicing factor SYF1